jgi:hypothetical protein
MSTARSNFDRGSSSDPTSKFRQRGGQRWVEKNHNLFTPQLTNVKWYNVRGSRWASGRFAFASFSGKFRSKNSTTWDNGYAPSPCVAHNENTSFKTVLRNSCNTSAYTTPVTVLSAKIQALSLLVVLVNLPLTSINAAYFFCPKL